MKTKELLKKQMLNGSIDLVYTMTYIKKYTMTEKDINDFIDFYYKEIKENDFDESKYFDYIFDYIRQSYNDDYSDIIDTEYIYDVIEINDSFNQEELVENYKKELRELKLQRAING